jgi:hypothetical protein
LGGRFQSIATLSRCSHSLSLAETGPPGCKSGAPPDARSTGSCSRSSFRTRGGEASPSKLRAQLRTPKHARQRCTSVFKNRIDTAIRKR